MHVFFTYYDIHKDTFGNIIDTYGHTLWIGAPQNTGGGICYFLSFRILRAANYKNLVV